jgi:hypothetical protein
MPYSIVEYYLHAGITVIEVRVNYLELGAAEKKDLEHVRPPHNYDEQIMDFSL